MTKRKISLVLAAMFLMSNGLIVSAEIPNEPVTEATYSEIHYNTEEVNIGCEPYDIVDFTISQNVAQIDSNGESVFIDVQGTLTDGTIVDLSEYAEWHSDNPEIIFADRGRLLGLSAGTATITVTYGDFTEEISSSVLNEVDLAEVISDLNHSNVQMRAAKSATDIGKEMVEYSWKPTSSIRGWRNEYTFKANTTYTGIPYSQTANQVDKSGFETAMGKSDFYSNYTRNLNNEDIIMPRYGSDCSGFVSFCWGISRQTTAGFVAGIKDGTYAKVGTYNATSPTTSELKTAYKSLVAGNAVVKSGHTFLIASNDTENSKVYVYEQTPYKALYTSWTYDNMASGKYMPFKKK